MKDSDSHPFYCLQVGVVGADSEAGIEPEDAGFAEGCKISGWSPSNYLRNSVVKVSATRGKKGGREGKR